jgi:hypothetical protein
VPQARSTDCLNEPSSAQGFSILLQPLQGDDQNCVVNFATVKAVEGVDGRFDEYADVLTFICVTMYAVYIPAVDAAAEKRDYFRGTAGAREDIDYGYDIHGCASRFFESFSVNDLLHLFAIFDDAGDNFDQPRSATIGGKRPYAELLNENNSVSVGVIEQHGRSIASLKHLLAHFVSPAAFEEAVTQAIAVESKESFELALFLNDFHVITVHRASFT